MQTTEAKPPAYFIRWSNLPEPASLRHCAAVFVWLCLLPCTTAMAAPIAYLPLFTTHQVEVIDLESGSRSQILVGLNPGGITLDGPRQRAYVTNLGSNELSVIDLAAPVPTVIHTVDTGVTPSGVELSPDGAHIYVTNFNAGSLSIIDAAAKSPTVIHTLSLGGNPDGITFNADGSRAYIANAEDLGGMESWVTLIDASQRPPLVLGQVTVPPEAHGIAFANDRLFVVGSDTHQLTILDATDDALPTVDSITVGQRPYSLVTTPSGDRVYLTSSEEANVYVVDTSQVPAVVLPPIPVESWGIGITLLHDLGRLYVANADAASLSVIDVGSEPPALIDTLDTGASPIAFGRFVTADPPALFNDGFESGNTEAWSATTL